MRNTRNRYLVTLGACPSVTHDIFNTLQMVWLWYLSYIHVLCGRGTSESSNCSDE